MERDDGLRAACFLALDALRAQLGDELPYRGGLDAGFTYDGARVPFLNRQEGIFRARAQGGPSALAIQTSFESPYDDEETALGFLYAYRAGAVDHYANRALRAAHELGVPLVYYVATRPGWYRSIYPCYVSELRPAEKRVLVTPGVLDDTLPAPAAVPLNDPLERRYAVRETRVRLHQARFRGRVLLAYRDRCTICRLSERQLLDAAHIIRDVEAHGVATVSNGLSLCSIHHRAFDQHLVGISPDYKVRLSRRLLDDDDGPMLDLLKGFHGRAIELPRRAAARPDRDRLAARFDAFLERG